MNPAQLPAPPQLTPEPQSVIDALSSLHSACSGWHAPDWTTTAGSVCAQVTDHNVVSWIWVGGVLFGLSATYMFARLLRFSITPTSSVWGDRVVYVLCGLLGGFFTTIFTRIGTWPWDVSTDWRVTWLTGAVLFIVVRFLGHWHVQRAASGAAEQS